MTAFPRQSLLATAGLAIATAICFAVPAAGQTVENFYKSHELTILIGHPPVADAIRKTMLPFTVSSIAQAAAVASLAAEAELLERVETVVKERDRVRSALLADGWTVPVTEANFVWLRLGEHTTAFAAACEGSCLAVRPFAGEGARVSIGSPEANDAFLATARAFPHRT